MAWTCSGQTQSELIENLVKTDIIRTQSVKDAMLQTDRALYMDRPEYAYSDAPQGIGYQQTISAPHMHAHALELLADKLIPGATVLDVGSGSGYLTACMARMVAPTGKVYGIEFVPELVRQSQENVQKDASDLLESKVLNIMKGDGWKGLADKAPFDAIHVGAAAAETPHALVEQLSPNEGKLIIPVGGQFDMQYLMQYTRKGDSVERKQLMGVRYVPLVHDDDDEPNNNI